MTPYGGPGIVAPHDALAPNAIAATRQSRQMRYRTSAGVMRSITFYDQYSPDDVLMNMAKAVLVALARQKGYNRPETPWKLKRAVSRVGLVF